MRALRVYHAGRDPAHRLRDRALVEAGVDLTLVVPAEWPEGGAERTLPDEAFPVVELPVERAGDVNRHRYTTPARLKEVLSEVDPDVLDLHEEPFSVAARQWLAAAGDVPVVMYTAQNVDKRLPPPFTQWERSTYARIQGLYPCSRQAASVARGKGFARLIDVLPLGYDPSLFDPGVQTAADDQIVLGIVGRLVPEKGITDAVRVLAEVRRHRAARLEVIGRGPEEVPARALAGQLGVADAVAFLPWLPIEAVAQAYRRMHVALLPSRATQTWVEQFGRVIVEAQAAGAVVAGYASGSIPEVGGDTALLVPEGDVAALAGRLADLLTDPATYAARRAAGLAAVEDMSWERVAARQAALYARVAAGEVPEVELPASPAERRRLAREEFGPTAALAGGITRPFALPVLRTDSPLTRGLGRLIDAVQR